MARTKTRFTWEEQVNMVRQTLGLVVNGDYSTELVYDRGGYRNNVGTIISRPDLNVSLISGVTRYYYGEHKYLAENCVGFQMDRTEKAILEKMPTITNKKCWLFYSKLVGMSDVLSWSSQEPIFRTIQAVEKESIYHYTTVISNTGTIVIVDSSGSTDSDPSHWTQEGGYLANRNYTNAVYARYRNHYLENLFKTKYDLDLVIVQTKYMKGMVESPEMEDLRGVREVY